MRNVPTKNLGDLYSTEDFNYGVNDELKSILNDSGQSFDQNNNKQLLNAVNLIVSGRTTFKELPSSSGSSYQLTCAQDGVQPLLELLDGASFIFEITNSNTVENPTITLDGVSTPTNIPLTKENGDSLAIGELRQGQIVSVMYSVEASSFKVYNFNSAQESTQEVNSANLYNVIGFSSNNYDLEVSRSDVEPNQYYGGMIVRFIVSNTNTGASTLTIHTISASVLKPLKIDGKDVAAGDLKAGTIVTCMYNEVGMHFDILTMTRQSWLSSDNRVLSKDTSSTPHTIANLNPMGIWSNLPEANPWTLSSQQDKQTILLNLYQGNPLSQITINLPSLSNISDTFSCKFFCEYAQFANSSVKFVASSGDIIRYFGPAISQSTTEVEIQIVNNQTFELIYRSNGYFSLHTVPPANEQFYGTTRYSTSTEAQDTNNDTTAITPKQLHAVLADMGYVALQKAYPVGIEITMHNNDAPPNDGTMTWVEITEGYVGITGNSSNVGTYAGTQSAYNGSTLGHALSAGESGNHYHHIATNQQVVGDNQVDATSPVAVDYNDGGQFRYQLQKGSGTPTVGVTSTVGGNQPHSHQLDIAVLYVRKYKRTV